MNLSAEAKCSYEKWRKYLEDERIINITDAEIRLKICEYRALLQSIVTDPRALERYEDLKVEVSSLQLSIDEHSKKLIKSDQALEELRISWQSDLVMRIKDMKSAFSAYYKSLNCEGNIELRCEPNQEFDQYGIDILVSYRKGTVMKTLSAGAHSGGEKSVATILYLLSLQRVTEAPFRIVDEINQGMDEDNERKVFHIVSEATSFQQMESTDADEKIASQPSWAV